MWKHLLAVVMAWTAAGPAAAQFEAPIFDRSGPPLPAPPPPPPPNPVVDRGSGTPYQMGPPVPGKPVTTPTAYVDSPVDGADPFADMFGPPRQHLFPGAWLNSELLFWGTRGVNVPPVVTTGPATAGVGLAGLLGQPGTAVLFGGDRTLTQMRPGYRFEVGAYFGESATYGLSARYYALGAAAEQLVGGSNGLTVVNVPQVLAVNGAPVQFPVYVGFPGTTIGTVTATTHTNLLGADVNLRRRAAGGDDFRVDLLAGYRYLHLGDTLNVGFDVVSATAPPVTAPRLLGEDSYRTRNNFHGAQVGFAAGTRGDRFSFDLQSTVALGATAAELDVSRTRTPAVGSVVATQALAAAGAAQAAALTGLPIPTPGAPGVRTGGAFQTSYFAVVPEVGFKVGYHPADNVRLTVGYNFLYWSRVRRAPEQYDLGPTPADRATGFWAQGLTFGLDVRY